ncbi:MAG: dienelactone hydrolase family protein [Clostridia bacterium]|nr:dienelactone hydrolase family protein [Clostridia bacterium]
MIVSAVSLWKKYNLKSPLSASEWGEETSEGRVFSHLSYSGHTVSDGSVRIYARFGKPVGEGKFPVVIFLREAGKPVDEELMGYFIDKGYAVLMPDYSGKMKDDEEKVMRTIYPASLDYGNYEKATGLYSLKGVDIEKTSWVEWTYVALYSIEYLKTRTDVGNIGIVGVRIGGAIAWQTMLSPDLKCGIPINSAGWQSFLNTSKFGGNLAHNLSDDRHRYIAAVEAQSYAPSVKCPVLMLCSLRDKGFDCDRAYDTYSRIGNPYGNALVYSPDSGACIGPNGLADMDLFLEKNLKGREIYIPDGVNVSIKEGRDGLEISVDCDKEGILEEAGIFYAEADYKTRSTYREWRCVYKTQGRAVKNGKFQHTVKPFDGATAVFVYAYAKYINGFRVMSKISSKKLENCNPNAVKSRRIFSGEEMDCFGVAEYEDYSIGGIFLERDAVPKMSVGYGDIKGAYSVGGIRTYKISSPKYIPSDNALLEFDAYSETSQELLVSIEVADVESEEECYQCVISIKGGGKWKRIILKAGDFKGETYGAPLQNFNDGSALVFDCAGEETEFAVTNILWL